MEFARRLNRPSRADDSYREAPMPPGRSLFFSSAQLAKPRHLAAMARLSARFQVILAVAVATGACAGGCSTLHRPIQSSVTPPSSTSPTAATVRAQNAEPAASPVISGSAVTAPLVPNTVVSDGPGVALPEGPDVAPTDGAPDPPPGGSQAPRVVTGPSTRCSSRYSVRRRPRVGLRCC